MSRKIPKTVKPKQMQQSARGCASRLAVATKGTEPGSRRPAKAVDKTPIFEQRRTVSKISTASAIDVSKIAEKMVRWWRELRRGSHRQRRRRVRMRKRSERVLAPGTEAR